MAVQVILEFTDAQWALIVEKNMFTPLGSDGLPIARQEGMQPEDLALYLKQKVSSTIATQIRREQMSKTDPFDV